MNPEFIMFLGPMFSGKTSRLLSQIDRYQYMQKKIIVFKPRMDNRYFDDEVASHAGYKVPAVSITNGNELLEYLLKQEDDYDVIAVDEAFMIDGVAESLIRLFRLGKTVLVSSIDMSANCTAFDEIKEMMIWATKIDKCSAICVKCFKDAFYTQRKVESDNLIQVGGIDLYEARCWSCHTDVNLTIV